MDEKLFACCNNVEDGRMHRSTTSINNIIRHLAKILGTMHMCNNLDSSIEFNYMV